MDKVKLSTLIKWLSITGLVILSSIACKNNKAVKVEETLYKWIGTTIRFYWELCGKAYLCVMKTEKEILENLLLPPNKEWGISSIKTDEKNEEVIEILITSELLSFF
jgi:hypothetical protein